MQIERRASAPEGEWWRDAVIYEIYLRSFADGNGDGVGDLAGVRARLAYLAQLGIDAIWFTPWYPSPMADGGYDISDYRAVHPAFGSLDEATALIEAADAYGIRVIVDVVPNHVSDQHPWFQAAIAAEPGAPERSRFWFRPGLGPTGDEAPTSWVSNFGGTAWTRSKNPDGTPGEWYLHLFTPEQPDLNWSHPDVPREHLDILRFWFDRGAAGVRIDSAALLAKDPELPEVAPERGPGEHPYEDRDELHGIYRDWRRVADSYPEPRALIGELWVADVERFTRYLQHDELHTAFNFDYLTCPWEPERLRASIDSTLAAHQPMGAAATWVLANHDVTRPVTRYGRADSSFSFAAKQFDTPTDLDLGRRRARAAALLSMALPGAVYLYQGDELGLPEVEDIPPELREDPMYFRSGGRDPGRDGCRVPMPWSGNTPPYGFSPDGATSQPWLPQPPSWAGLTAAAQDGDPSSMLELYRVGIALRRQHIRGAFGWLGSGPDVLAFQRGDGFGCVVNLGPGPVDLPPGELLLASAALDAGRLAPDSAAWLHLT